MARGENTQRRDALIVVAAAGLLVLAALALDVLGVRTVRETVPATVFSWRMVYIVAGITAAAGAMFVLRRPATRLRRLGWAAPAMTVLGVGYLVAFHVLATVTPDRLTYVIGFGSRPAQCERICHEARGCNVVCPAGMGDEECAEELVDDTDAIAVCWGETRIQLWTLTYWAAVALTMFGAGAVIGLFARQRGPNGEYERFINATNPHLSLKEFQDGLERARRAVCKIEVAGASGTGFLVGPDLVLTNQHVIADATRAADVVVRFDHDEHGPGTVAPLADAWQVAASPPAADEDAPRADELDFALLRLAAPQVGRPWLVPHAHTFPASSALIIVQHPRGQPIKIALDTSAVISATPTRVRYRTNTDHGSSGSPCFDATLRLVALHHYGDPAWKDPTFNQGIPLAAIVAHLRARGIELPPAPTPS